LKCFESSES